MEQPAQLSSIIRNGTPMTQLHQDPEISLASALMFLGIGKFVEWLTGHAEFFAGVSYILTSVAALATLYYKVKNKGK